MTSSAIASLDVKQSKDVTRQVEFYFSDSNLPRDNFLSRTVSESEDGLVSLSLICSFSRMKKHLGLDDGVKPETVPEDKILAVAETLRKSSFLRVSEDGKRIGRSTDLPKPEEVIEQVDSRTISVSPLPYNVLLEDLESFFNQYGKVNSVRLPRRIADKRHFCGTALVEFSEEAVAQDALKQSLVYAGAELETKPKKEFDSERAKLREEFEKSLLNKNFSDPKECYPKGLIISFKLKIVTGGEPLEDEKHEMQLEDTGGGGEENSASEVVTGGEPLEDEKHEMQLEDTGDGGEKNSASEAAPDNEKKDGDNLDKGNEQNFGKESDKGSAKEETQLNDKKNTITREDLKETIQRFGTVKFIDYKMGDEGGYIRFEDPDAAIKARAAAILTDDGGFVVKKCVVTLEAVTGEAEKEYWSTLRDGQERFRGNKGNRGRGRGNRGGKHFSGKRGRDTDVRDRTANAKVQKVTA